MQPKSREQKYKIVLLNYESIDQGKEAEPTI